GDGMVHPAGDAAQRKTAAGANAIRGDGGSLPGGGGCRSGRAGDLRAATRNRTRPGGAAGWGADLRSADQADHPADGGATGAALPAYSADRRGWDPFDAGRARLSRSGGGGGAGRFGDVG